MKHRGYIRGSACMRDVQFSVKLHFAFHPPLLKEGCTCGTPVVPWNLDEEAVKRQIDARAAAEKAAAAFGKARAR